MTSKKISELTAGSVLGGSELVMIVQGGVTKRTTISDIMVGSSTVGGELLAGETDAMGIDFTYHTDITKQHYISDLTTPANNYNGTAQGKLTYTSPSVKLCRQSDGVYRYVNHNYCLESQTFGTSPWALFGGASFGSQNAAAAPDGTMTADALNLIAGATSQVYQTHAGLTVGPTYRFSVWVKRNTGSDQTFRIGLVSGGAGEYSPDKTATSSWQRFTYDTAGASGQLQQWGVIADSGPTAAALLIWGFEVKRLPVNDAGGYTYATGYLATTTTAVYDLPYEWDVANASQGILIEEARTNLCVQSQVFGTSWTAGAVTVSSNSTTAPDGTSTADTIVEDGTSAIHRAYQNTSAGGGTVPANTTFTMSIFAKATGAGSTRYLIISGHTSAVDGFYAIFSLSGGGSVTESGKLAGAVLTSSSIVSAGNGWFRCTLTGQSSSDNPYFINSLSDSATPGLQGGGSIEYTYTGDSTSGLYLWGAQVELGAFATSPIHTIAATVTRAADNISIATTAFPYQSQPHSLYAKAVIDVQTGGLSYNEMISITSGGGSELRINSSNALSCQYGAQADVVSTANGNSWLTGVRKAAVRNTDDDWAISQDGGTVAVNTSTTATGAMTVLYIGGRLDNSLMWNGHIHQIAFYKRGLTNGQLQSKTT